MTEPFVSVYEPAEISLDGATGEVFAGSLPTVHVNFDDQVDLLIPRGSNEFVRHIMAHTNIPGSANEKRYHDGPLATLATAKRPPDPLDPLPPRLGGGGQHRRIHGWDERRRPG